MPMVSTGVGGRMAMRAFRRVIEPDYADCKYWGWRREGHRFYGSCTMGAAIVPQLRTLG